jgi:pimeloyl-ACP methyl ester carboxylesterase
MFPAGLEGYRAHIVALPSGERVRVVESGPDTGPPVVFLGGWGCSAWDYNRTLAPVVQAGFRAIAFDARGHGLSDMPADESLYTTDAMLIHLRATLDALGLPRVSLVGHSMGGALITHFALANPARVRSLVLISSVGFGDTRIAELGRTCLPSWVTPLARIAFRRWTVAAGLRLLYFTPGQVDPRNVDEYWAPSQFHGFVPAMRALLHRFRWSRFTDEEVARLSMPCLVVRGGRDPVVRPSSPPVPMPPEGRELLIPGAGHLPHDEMPDRVNPEIIAFLSMKG